MWKEEARAGGKRDCLSFKTVRMAYFGYKLILNYSVVNSEQHFIILAAQTGLPGKWTRHSLLTFRAGSTVPET